MNRLMKSPMDRFSRYLTYQKQKNEPTRNNTHLTNQLFKGKVGIIVPVDHRLIKHNPINNVLIKSIG